MNNSKISTIILLLLIGLSLYGQDSRTERRIRKQAKKEMIASKVDSLVKIKDINFNIFTIIPQTMPSRQTSDGYFLSIKKDSLNCHLPFFGRSTSPVFGGSDQSSLIIKDQIIKIFEKEYSKKNGYTLYFECKNDSTKETWNITMHIFRNGVGKIYCKTYSKDIMSYLGDFAYHTDCFAQ